MTAVIEVQSHKSITRFQYGEQNGSVSLSTRVSLHVEYNGGITKNYPINNAWLFGVEYLIHDAREEETFMMNHPYQGLYLNKEVEFEIKDCSEGAVILILTE